MVLTSILIGLGIAELLYGLVRMLRSDFKEKFFLPQAIWSFFIFLHLIMIWWSRWDLRENFEWNILQLLLSLAAPILLFILAGLIFPNNKNSRDHYYQQRVSFFNILIVVLLIDISHEVFIEGSAVFSLVNFLIFMMLLSSSFARFSLRDWVHTLSALACISAVGFFATMTVFSLS